MPATPHLRTLRERALLTQEELAQKSGVHPITISRIESGRTEPEIRTIRKLAKALGVEPQELVG